MREDNGRENNLYCLCMVFHLQTCSHNALTIIPVLLREIEDKIDDLNDIKTLIDSAIVESDIPLTVKEGGIIKEGYSAEIDELRSNLVNG